MTWIIALLCWAAMPLLNASAASVHLTWENPTTNADGSPLTDLSHLVVYVGTTSGTYGPPRVVGLTTEATVEDLTPGVEYFFVVTAVDVDGHESAYSPEVRTIPTDGLATQVFPPSADTFLNLNTTPYATDPWLGVYTWPDQKIANVMLFKFNLSAIPTGSTIASAILHLVLIESDETPGTTYQVTAHPIKKAWTAGQATGYRRTSSAKWTANACCYGKIPMAQKDIGPAVASIPVGIEATAYTWDLTTLVRQWTAGTVANHGVLLNADATQPRDRYRFFASQEAADVPLRPALVVLYEEP